MYTIKFIFFLALISMISTYDGISIYQTKSKLVNDFKSEINEINLLLNEKIKDLMFGDLEIISKESNNCTSCYINITIKQSKVYLIPENFELNLDNGLGFIQKNNSSLSLVFDLDLSGQLQKKNSNFTESFSGDAQIILNSTSFILSKNFEDDNSSIIENIDLSTNFDIIHNQLNFDIEFMFQEISKKFRKFTLKKIINFMETQLKNYYTKKKIQSTHEFEFQIPKFKSTVTVEQIDSLVFQINKCEESLTNFFVLNNSYTHEANIKFFEKFDQNLSDFQLYIPFSLINRILHNELVVNLIGIEAKFGGELDGASEFIKRDHLEIIFPELSIFYSINQKFKLTTKLKNYELKSFKYNEESKIEGYCLFEYNLSTLDVNSNTNALNIEQEIGFLLEPEIKENILNFTVKILNINKFRVIESRMGYFIEDRLSLLIHEYLKIYILHESYYLKKGIELVSMTNPHVLSESNGIIIYQKF